MYLSRCVKGIVYSLEVSFSSYQFSLLPKFDVEFLFDGFKVQIGVFSFFITFIKIKKLPYDEMEAMLNLFSKILSFKDDK